MKQTFTAIMMYIMYTFIPISAFSQAVPCDLVNYPTAYKLNLSDYPYTSPISGITVTSTIVGYNTTASFTYACGPNNYETPPPALWLNSAAQIWTLTFSVPVTSISFSLNGSNSGEIFTVTPSVGTVSISNYCVTGGFSDVGNTLVCGPTAALGTMFTATNTTPATTYVITHNGAGSGSRIALMDCFIGGCISIDSVNVEICDNQTYSIGTSTYSAPGWYVDTLTVGDCDSVVFTNLIVNPTFSSVKVDSFYEGTSYTFNNNLFYYEGTYPQRFQTEKGCDSLISLRLIEIPVQKYDIDTTICSYQDFVFFGKIYTTSGRYIDTFVFSDHHKILNLRLIKKRPMDLSVLVDKDLNQLCIGQPLVLTGQGADDYIWYKKSSPLDEKLFRGNPYNAAVFDDYNHLVMQGIDADGCVESHPFSLVGHNCCQYFVPSAFSPNGDGLNDVFEVKGTQPRTYRMEIYNRWGTKVFTTENVNSVWNGNNLLGEPMPQDVYFYYITGQCYDGTDIDRRGDITLIR